MSPNDQPRKPSSFAALRGSDEPEPSMPGMPGMPGAAPHAASPAAPPPDIEPLKRRLEEIEKSVKSAEAANPEERIASLERQLQMTQHQAIAAMVRLSEREQAQKTAQTELENTLRSVNGQRRGEEVDRQLREQLAAQRARVDELEERLIRSVEAGVAESRRAHDQTAANASLSAQIETLSAQAAETSQMLERQRQAVEAATALAARALAASGADAARGPSAPAPAGELEALKAQLAGLVEERVARSEMSVTARFGALFAWRSTLEAGVSRVRGEVEAVGAALRELRVSRRASAGELDPSAELEAVKARQDRLAREVSAAAAAAASATDAFVRSRAELETGLDRATRGLASLETEMRGMILARIHKLESER